MYTFKKGLPDPKIKGFFLSCSGQDIFQENPETRDEIFNQILIEDLKRKNEEKNLKKSFRQKTFSFLSGRIMTKK